MGSKLLCNPRRPEARRGPIVGTRKGKIADARVLKSKTRLFHGELDDVVRGLGYSDPE